MMIDKALEQLRAICLALPETTEAGGVGDPTFRVRDKIFAMQHPADGRPSMWCKAARGMQDVLVSSDPGRFFVPPYVGQHGWVGLWLDIDLDWDFVAYLVKESYRLTAPKRLIALLDQTGKAG
jgi:predicted DNA-binding protein (MmcQ/YjbR family)